MNREYRSQMAEILQNALPQVTLVGATGLVIHEKVVFIHTLIASSGIPEQIDAWWCDDRADKRAGGPGRLISTQSILTLLLLSSAESDSQEMRKLARFMEERLGPDSLELLGLGHENRSREDWYAPLRFALRRVTDTLDPKPGRRNKFPTQDEFEAMLAKREELNTSKKQVRIDWVCNQLLQATMQTLPAEAWTNWKGDLTVDATVVPAYGKKGAPWKSDKTLPGLALQAIEYDAGWYLRNGNHDVVETKGKARKAVFGWDVTLATMTKHDPSLISDFPQLVLGIGMTQPGRDLIHTARRIFESIVGRGHPTGRITGDRGYVPSAIPADFQIPLRQMGYDLVTDYKIDQLGNKGGYAGAILVEGAFYCPSMPTPLVNATKEFRAKRISREVWFKRINQRKQYMLRPKEKPDANGNVPMVCPARGSGATVSCPIANACGTAPYDAKTPILKPPGEHERGAICTNKASVKFPVHAGAKYLQKYQFGTKEWQTIYSTDRSTIEGVNGNLKTSAISIDAAERRRVRGYSAQYLLITILVATENLRRIQTFRDELTRHASIEDREDYFKRKQAAKDKRKNNAYKRANPWDNFAEKSEAEREEEAPLT